MCSRKNVNFFTDSVCWLLFDELLAILKIFVISVWHLTIVATTIVSSKTKLPTCMIAGWNNLLIRLYNNFVCHSILWTEKLKHYTSTDISTTSLNTYNFMLYLPTVVLLTNKVTYVKRTAYCIILNSLVHQISSQ